MSKTKINPEKIPKQLKVVNNWIGWRSEKRNGDETKVPYNPITEKRASSTDPETWTNFETLKNKPKYGLGFVFTDSPFAGVDLDHCRDPETGELEEWSRKVVKKLDSYTEISPSGEGLHILIKGEIPGDRNRDGNLELYETGRYFTVTGNHLDGTPEKIQEHSEELKDLYEKVFEGENQEPETDLSGEGTDLPDKKVLELARNAKNGEKFKRLWDGDTSDYPSHSEADQALCSLLAFYTGPDGGQIDRLFRESGLSRDKWAEREDYRQRTIETALSGHNEFYRPPRSETPPEELLDDPPPPNKKSDSDSGSSKKDPDWRPSVTKMGDVDPEEIRWLWKPYIPSRKITLLEGDPGVGKTFLALQLSARISNGEDFITGRNTRGANQVLYMTAEDGIADTLRPRIDDMNGNPDNIHVLKNKINSETGEKTFVTLDDLVVIITTLRDIDPDLVVVDPLQGFLGSEVDMNMANEVRPILANVADLAEEFNTSFLLIRHLTKSARAKSMYRGIGSIDFTAHARSILMAGEDPDNEEQLAMVHVKSNLTESGPSLGYRLDDGIFKWTGESELRGVDITEPEKSRGEKSKFDQAMEFLRVELSEGPVQSSELKDRAEKELGISERTLENAYYSEQLPTNSFRESGEGGHWYWSIEEPDEEK